MNIQEKLQAIIEFLKTYNINNDDMQIDWKYYRGYYVQAYIWGWQCQDYRQQLREMSRLVPGYPGNMISKLEAGLSKQYGDKIIESIYFDITEGPQFTRWREALVQ